MYSQSWTPVRWSWKKSNWADTRDISGSSARRWWIMRSTSWHWGRYCRVYSRSSQSLIFVKDRRKFAFSGYFFFTSKAISTYFSTAHA
jgi:hypothetical protein